jgi:DNA helicase-2/ATP-dependent DNA helicase PcrA
MASDKLQEEYLKRLNEKIKSFPKNKQKAITSGSKYLRIIAGAGAGKTTTLAMKIVYLLCHGAEPREIVAFTFTERAAKNMKNKVYDAIKGIRPDLYNHLGEMYIGTMHAFCFQVLQDYFGYGNYDVLDDNQEVAFILRNGWSFGFGNQGNYTKNCLRFLKSISVVYEEMLPEKTLEKEAYGVHTHLKRYEDMLKENKFLVFSQMTSLLVQKLAENKTPLHYVKHLIVDEYQDINKAQQSLICLLGNWSNVYAVGDPRQCIYQWRGSNKEYLDKFAEGCDAFKGAETIDLSENFRSCSEIVKRANLFADTLKDKYPQMVPQVSETGEVIKIVFENPEDEAEKIVKQIKEWVDKGICNYSSIAVLLRSVKTSGSQLIDVLKEKDIPYIVSGKIGLFKRDESRLFGMLFAWTHSQGFWSDNLYGSSKIVGNDLLSEAKSIWKRLFKKTIFPEKNVNRWKKAVVNGDYRDLTDAFQELLLILGFVDLDIEEKENAAIMANLGRFNTLLTDFQTSILLGGRDFNWNNNLKDLSWFMGSYGIEAYGEQPAEDIRGLDAVQVMTIHQAKGLEWPIVFVPALVKGRFPSSKIGTEQEWDLPRRIFPVDRYEGDEDDERRLFYVTITRAKDVLCLSHFKKINRNMKESKFLEDLELPSQDFGNGIGLPKVSSLNKEEEIQTFSPGELISYCRCNYCYKLRHLWGYQSKFDRMLGFGKSLHHVLRRVSEIVKKDKVDPEKALDEVFEKEGFHLPFVDKITGKEVAEKAKETLKKYVKANKQDILNIAEVEARVEFPLEKATISGRVDVILGPKDSLEVRDYKTSDVVTSEDEAKFQVKLYALGLNMMDKNITKGSVAYIKEVEGKAQVIPVDVTKKGLEEANKTAETVIKDIKAGNCKPIKGKPCESQDFAKLCKYANKENIKTVVRL